MISDIEAKTEEDIVPYVHLIPEKQQQITAM